jgi:hypothetical protein
MAGVRCVQQLVELPSRSEEGGQGRNEPLHSSRVHRRQRRSLTASAAQATTLAGSAKRLK